MIKEYAEGREFINENSTFLDQNRYMSVFFYLDADLLTKPSVREYALKVTDGERKLLALKVSHYDLQLYGDPECLGELIDHLNDKKYEYGSVLCATDIGEKLMNITGKYKLMIGMDFMETRQFTEESSAEVCRPTEDDLDEMHQLINRFYVDCGLPDSMEKEKLMTKLKNFRIIREEGQIVSLAAFSPDGEDFCKIAYVYTRPEYRGKGFGRKVVNTIKNEILAMGKTAVLNVDVANPISNHLYESLGFRKVFSQGVYIPK